MQKIVLNPDYILKNDLKRVVLASESMTTIIHPLHGMILSFFDQPTELNSAIEIIAKTIPISKTEIVKFLNQIIYNNSEIWIGNNQNAAQFPKNVLIEVPFDYKSRDYNFRDFFIKGDGIDLEARRFFKPLDALLVINTICYTDCIYCYADRRNKFDLQIPIERLFALIDEARCLKMRSFDISGGEFFLYKHWDKLLTKLIDSGFIPKAIPTKVPLSIDTIRKIKDIGYNQIQISIDSINSHVLKKTLGVHTSYFQNIQNMIETLYQYGIKFRVNSLITSYNCEYENFVELIEYMKQWDNFVDISIGVVGYSLYKTNEINYENFPKLEKAQSIMKQLHEEFGKDSNVILSDVSTYKDNSNFTTDKFFAKALCTGNKYGFVILPDGKTTICEELYWHPEFVLGDLTTQSIMEMWSSEKAKNLFNLKQAQLSEKSHCCNCEYFINCRQNAGVCWREVVKTYGVENWDFPDPRCPFAPEKINNLYID